MYFTLENILWKNFYTLEKTVIEHFFIVFVYTLKVEF